MSNGDKIVRTIIIAFVLGLVASFALGALVTLLFA